MKAAVFVGVYCLLMGMLVTLLVADSRQDGIADTFCKEHGYDSGREDGDGYACVTRVTRTGEKR
jgi:hypothetical protein